MTPIQAEREDRRFKADAESHTLLEAGLAAPGPVIDITEAVPRTADIIKEDPLQQGPTVLVRSNWELIFYIINVLNLTPRQDPDVPQFIPADRIAPPHPEQFIHDVCEGRIPVGF